jgi:hypothetical protein
MGSVSDNSKWTILCPDCETEIVIDRSTGAVLYHKPAPKKSGAEKNFDALLADIDASKARANDIFQQEVSALKDRDRLLEEKFREALRRAESEPEDEPPVRPWDLD